MRSVQDGIEGIEGPEFRPFEAEPEEPKKRGRKKSEPKASSKKRSEPAPEPEIIDWDTFTTAITVASELLDEGLWHLGMDTDPNIGGASVWALDVHEAEVLVERIFKPRAERSEIVRLVIVTVNTAYGYYEAGLILGSRFAKTVYWAFTEGINVRMMSKERWVAIQAEIEAEANDDAR